jgi:hypothetical protein
MAAAKSFLKLPSIIVLSMLVMHCNSSDPGPDVSASPIKVLAPRAEARFTAADTIMIISECDYSKVAGNLSAIFSPDSGKTWELILSAAHHNGVAKDTFPFFPKDFGILAGQKVKLQLKEYGTASLSKDIGFIHID